jgi:signal peptidase I
VLPDRAKPQYSYTVTTDGSSFDQDYIIKELQSTDGVYQTTATTFIFRALTEEAAARLKQNPVVKNVERNISKTPEAEIFPKNNRWNMDNFGPIYIPQEGKTVALDAQSLPFYKRIITEYEHNTLNVTGNEIRINGKVATSYTFRQNYYWMMGDNRHNSEDSRYWGYVPEDHIVGKPVFIWFSLDPNASGLSKIRWDRVFTTVGGSGERVSYLKFFLIALVLYFGIDGYLKKKRAAKE